MVKPLRILITGVASVSALALVPAAPAQADEATYLERLLPVYGSYVSPQELLAEGHRVCQAQRSGRGSAGAVSMVMKDLAASVSLAYDIVSAATVEFGC
jgi:hypothetical protein